MGNAAMMTCLLAVALSSVSVRAEEIKIGGTGAALGTMKILAQAFKMQMPTVTVKVIPSLGSGGGIKALRQGALDIAVSARRLNADESAAGLVAADYAQTALVFATSASNPVSKLDLQSLAKIYSGDTLNWPNNHPIRVVLRPAGEADTVAIKKLSPAMAAAVKVAENRQGMAIALTDQEAANALEKVPGSLGSSTLALMLSEKRALKPLTIDGIAPDIENIANGRYPLIKTFSVVLGPTPREATQAFVNFLRTPEARQILASTGHWVK